MMSTELVMAQYANTRRSRVNDPDLERYLREEYPGGMTVEALLAGTVPPNGRGRAAFLPLAHGPLPAPERLKPSPPPHDPHAGPRPNRGPPRDPHAPEDETKRNT